MGRRKRFLAWLVVGSALVGAACGGGGAGSEGEPAVEPPGPANQVVPPSASAASLDQEAFPSSVSLSQIFPSAIDDAVPQPRGVPVRTVISAESTTADQELFGFVGADGVAVLAPSQLAELVGFVDAFQVVYTGDASVDARSAQLEPRITVINVIRLVDAEGADRLVASLAMRVLKASLQVPLPLPYDLYATDFSTQESIDDFQDLVGRAQLYFEIPMKFGNIRSLASSQDQGVKEARNRQYALAGAYVVQRSDCLLAIYDGLAENGTGGTSQIVRWYNEGGIPPEYLYPSNFFLPPRKDPLIVINPNQAADSK